MLVSVLCNCHKSMKFVECGCSKDSVALGGAKSGEGNARDTAGISRDSSCVCV